MTDQLEERCFHYFEARRERKKERDGEGDGLTDTYKDQGCFTCYGKNKECRAYTGIDVKMPLLKSCRPFKIYEHIWSKK